jgi:hypothetical protein
MADSEPLLAEQLDKLAIAELAQRERAARDARDWDTLLDSYHEDSRVSVSWLDGTAAGFVEASRQMVAKPGGGSQHQVGVPVVDVHGDRAIAETGCAILIRCELDGVEVDITAYCRHHSRVERRDGVWRLRTLIGVYQKDTLVPTNPNNVPPIDEKELAGYRESYKHLSYYAAHTGYEPSDAKPGIDRPDLVRELVDADEAWLRGGA